MASTAETLPHKHRLTVDEYYRMAETGILAPDARVELVEGEIIDMAPIGSMHAAQVNRLLRVFSQAIGDRALLQVQNPVILNGYTELQPDLALLAPKSDYYETAHPRPDDVLLVVEVADTSLQYDRDVKLPRYAAHGIPEYWLVDLADKRLFVHREPDPTNKTYRRVETPASLKSITPAALPDVTVDLSEMF